VFLFTGVLAAQTQDHAAPQTGTEQPATKTGIEQEISEPEKVEQQEPEPEKHVVIPVMEISDRAKETHIALNKIKANLEPSPDLLTIKEELPRFLYSLKRSKSGWFYKSLNSLNTRKLQNLRQE